ncbi:MAG TPA: hypothetical protein VM142_01590 [Acidimicrobiales bacterium]|nr:hypothetical protein [Acidimicrobiales bacterium]
MVLGSVAVDEVGQIGGAHRVRLEHEVHLGAQVVHPRLLGPRIGGCALATLAVAAAMLKRFSRA